ncbi:hypothetical protein IV203_002397 [Nitzschia inconspicua]|uniref:Uncharacterized protein n=1 Tax=Nitzschia inconspicua TaxID=303405 RepID=A0A9K3L8I0_9STRA|nr:hypothetical protein IV203_002397 [Nitzschia inconspicua]
MKAICFSLFMKSFERETKPMRLKIIEILLGWPMAVGQSWKFMWNSSLPVSTEPSSAATRTDSILQSAYNEYFLRNGPGYSQLTSALPSWSSTVSTSSGNDLYFPPVLESLRCPQPNRLMQSICLRHGRYDEITVFMFGSVHGRYERNMSKTVRQICCCRHPDW